MSIIYTTITCYSIISQIPWKVYKGLLIYLLSLSFFLSYTRACKPTHLHTQSYTILNKPNIALIAELQEQLSHPNASLPQTEAFLGDPGGANWEDWKN